MIKISQACLGVEEREAIDRVFADGYLGMGKEVMLFETELKAFIGNDVEVACVNTGTSALHLATQACGIGPGDEVIIPSLTYVASFQAVSATGATPIACDVDLSTGFMDVEDAARKITPRTKALMPVHYAGGFGDLAGVYELAKRHNLRVIEDAAHSFSGYYQGQRVGATGDIICFSFDSIKNITCGEGGAVVTKDKKINAKIKDLRLLGVEKDSDKRYSGQRSWDFDVTEQGWRYHMSNINAAIGRAQLKKIDRFAATRRQLLTEYDRLLDTKNIEQFQIDRNITDPHMFPVKVNPDKRDSLKAYLQEHSIETGFHYKPNHLLTKYSQKNCPNAETLWGQMLTLPLHCNLKISDVEFITKTIAEFFKKG